MSQMRSAFYARRGGPAGDWWNVLHPPYTLWHLSYVVIGAALAKQVKVSTLLATLLAFFLAVGVGAHVLDEWNGRPLQTRIPDTALLVVGAVALCGAVTIGVLGVQRIGPWLVPFVIAGAVLVVAYDLELFGGLVHTDAGFALSWGAFPVLTAYFAQSGSISLAALLAAAGAATLSMAQRSLSTPARFLRRRTRGAEAVFVLLDGSIERAGTAELLAPAERALRMMACATVLVAAALAFARMS